MSQSTNETKNITNRVEDSSDNISSKDKLSIEIQTYESIIQTMKREDANEQVLAPLLTRLGNLYFSSQDYPKAINAYINAIIIRELNKSRTSYNTGDIGWHLIEIGNSLFRLHDFDLAEYPYKMALKVFSAISGPAGIEGMITATNNIALCKLNAGNPKGALPVFNATLKLSQKYGESQRIYITQVYISTCYLKMEQYDKCISLLKDPAIVSLAESESPLNLFRLETLADAFYKGGYIDSAISVYNKIASVKQVPEIADNIAEANLKLAQHYVRNKTYDKALIYALNAEKKPFLCFKQYYTNVCG